MSDSLQSWSSESRDIDHVTDIFETGFFLIDEQERLALEDQISKNESDLETRVRLLGFYSRRASRLNSEHGEALLKHLRILMLSHPYHPVFRLPQLLVGNRSREFREILKLWCELARQNSTDVRVLSNAARFWTPRGKKHAELLWSRSKELEPQNPRWPYQLSKLYHSMAGFQIPATPLPKRRQKFARMALLEAKLVLTLQNAGWYLNEGSRPGYLAEMAEFALNFDFLQDAEHFITELSAHKTSWSKRADELSARLRTMRSQVRNLPGKFTNK
jgi:hypothetical protein